MTLINAVGAAPDSPGNGSRAHSSAACCKLFNSASGPAAQAEILLEAIKALAAADIRADTLENIPLMLAASGWRSTAALLTHAAGCADAGDFLNAECNRQRAREQFIEANDVFRQFQEARAAAAAGIAAEAFR